MAGEKLHGVRVRAGAVALVLACSLWGGAGARRAGGATAWQWFLITGYAGRGRTATGTQAHWGEAAVDPRVVPLGAYVQVRGLGVFRAEDTGGLVLGPHVDIWEPTVRACYRITGYRQARWAWRRADLR